MNEDNEIMAPLYEFYDTEVPKQITRVETKKCCPPCYFNYLICGLLFIIGLLFSVIIAILVMSAFHLFQ